MRLASRVRNSHDLHGSLPVHAEFSNNSGSLMVHRNYSYVIGSLCHYGILRDSARSSSPEFSRCIGSLRPCGILICMRLAHWTYGILYTAARSSLYGILQPSARSAIGILRKGGLLPSAGFSLTRLVFARNSFSHQWLLFGIGILRFIGSLSLDGILKCERLTRKSRNSQTYGRYLIRISNAWLARDTAGFSAVSARYWRQDFSENTARSSGTGFCNSSGSLLCPEFFVTAACSHIRNFSERTAC